MKLIAHLHLVPRNGWSCISTLPYIFLPCAGTALVLPLCCRLSRKVNVLVYLKSNVDREGDLAMLIFQEERRKLIVLAALARCCHLLAYLTRQLK